MLGYLPVTKLEGIKNDEQRRRAQVNLFHICMRDILKPLRDTAADGVVLTSGDGVRRRCHPLLAAYIGDYPEQVLVTGIKNGLCPKGKLDKTLFGTENKCELRDIDEAVEVLQSRNTHPDGIEGYVADCKSIGIKPVNTFWMDYPHCDIYQALTPDIQP